MTGTLWLIDIGTVLSENIIMENGKKYIYIIRLFSLKLDHFERATFRFGLPKAESIDFSTDFLNWSFDIIQKIMNYIIQKITNSV